jgi:hypothetical protein
LSFSSATYCGIPAIITTYHYAFLNAPVTILLRAFFMMVAKPKRIKSMQNNRTKKNGLPGTHPASQLVFYEIMIQDLLDPQRAKWFEGMTLTAIESGEGGSVCTRIAGPVTDQPALHGLLAKIRDLNLTLISVRRLTSGTGTGAEVPIGSEPPG